MRAHTPRYVQLIRAVQQVTQQNIQSLVDDLTIGMSIHPREVKDFGAAELTVHKERYQFFLALAVFLLIAEFFVPLRRRPRDEWKGRFAA